MYNQVVQVVRSRYQKRSREESRELVQEGITEVEAYLRATRLSLLASQDFPPLASAFLFHLTRLLARIIPPSIAGLPPFRRVLIHRLPDCRPFPLQHGNLD